MSRQPDAKTLRALERIRKSENPHAAAKSESVHPSTVYRALAKMRDKR